MILILIVYDFTNFIDEHPGGGHSILSLCGSDGTK
jgi:cytochrome b involved in lipid metabolism